MEKLAKTMGETKKEAKDHLDKLAETIYKGSVEKIMMVRIGMMAKQIASLPHGMNNFLPSSLAKASMTLPVKAKAIKDLLEYSGLARHRIHGANINFDISQIERSVVETIKGNKLVKSGMWGIRQMDLTTVVAKYKAALDTVKKLHPNEPLEIQKQIAIRMWETTVAEGDPSSHTTTQGSLRVGAGGLTKLYTMFSGVSAKGVNLDIMDWNQVRHEIRALNKRYGKGGPDTTGTPQGEGGPRDEYDYNTYNDKKSKIFIRGIAKIATRRLATVLILAAVNAAQRYLVKGEKPTLKRFMTDAALLAFSRKYIIGSLLNSAASKIKYGTFSGFDVDSVFDQFLNLLGDFSANAWKLIEASHSNKVMQSGPNKGRLETEVIFERMVKDVIRGSDVIPTSKIPLRNLYDIYRMITRVD
jgi:hypothetical protein